HSITSRRQSLHAPSVPFWARSRVAARYQSAHLSAMRRARLHYMVCSPTSPAGTSCEGHGGSTNAHPNRLVKHWLPRSGHVVEAVCSSSSGNSRKFPRHNQSRCRVFPVIGHAVSVVLRHFATWCARLISRRLNSCCQSSFVTARTCAAPSTRCRV